MSKDKIPNKKQVREVFNIGNCIAYLFKNSNKIYHYQIAQLLKEVDKNGKVLDFDEF